MDRRLGAFAIPLGLSLIFNWVVQLTFTGAWANLFTALGIFAVAGVTLVVSIIVFAIWGGVRDILVPLFLGLGTGFMINWVWTSQANQVRKAKQFEYLHSPYKNSDSISFKLNGNTERIPMEIVAKGKVESIYISSNRLKSLPPDLVEVENLKELRLARTDSLDLNQAFDIISKLDLEELHLVVISAKYLPATLADLKTIRKFNLSANKQMDLDSLFNLLAKLPELEELEIGNLEKGRLPSSISALRRLNTLDLRSGQFTELPRSLTEMDSLRVLNLTKNPVAKNWWEFLDSTRVAFKVID